MAGSINSKTNNGVIKYIYFIQKTKTPQRQIAEENKASNIPLKYVKSPTSHDLRYQTGLRSGGEPCDKICNGIERIRKYSQDDYIERPCNTHCKLQ